MRRFCLSVLTSSLLVFNSACIVNATPIDIEIFVSQSTTLNYQLYLNGEKYMNSVDFELLRVKARDKVELSSKRSYLYLKGIEPGEYILKSKSSKFPISYRIVIDDDYLKTAHQTKMLSLSLSDEIVDNPSTVVSDEEQLFPLNENPNFPELSDLSHPDNPNNPDNSDVSGDEDSLLGNISSWIDTIFRFDFDFSLLPDGGYSDEDDSSDAGSENPSDEDSDEPNNGDSDNSNEVGSDNSNTGDSNDGSSGGNGSIDGSTDGNASNDNGNSSNGLGSNNDSSNPSIEDSDKEYLELETIDDLIGIDLPDKLPQTGKESYLFALSSLIIILGSVLLLSRKEECCGEE